MNYPDVVTKILQNLFSDEEYSRAVLPHLKEEYFSDQDEKSIFITIRNYIDKYNKLPERDVILIELDNSKGVFESTIEYFQETFKDNESTSDTQWLIDKTEEFCQDMSLHNALQESVNIAQQEDKSDSRISKTAIPDILKEALAVSFDSHIGSDYMNDVDERFEHYNEEQNKLAFALEPFNQITNGGMTNKSVMILLGGTGTGKSLFLTHMSTDFMKLGKNVLYITLEMSEKKVEERFDANLLGIDIHDLVGINKDKNYKAVEKIKKDSMGNIIVHEYPTGAAHVGHFRYLLNE